MSEGFERQDAQLFAEWKVDMLKIDSCAVHETNRTVIARWKQASPTLVPAENDRLEAVTN